MTEEKTMEEIKATQEKYITAVGANANKKIIVTMPNGDKYKIPATVIAIERAKYYSEKDFKEGDNEGQTLEELYFQELKYTLDNDDEILDWLGNNTDWNDVSAEAKLIPREQEKLSKRELNEGLSNGEKEIVFD